ncbi:MAG TPA: hypothetical protein VFQ57_03035 [Sphingomonas sp.]|jgi:hypothetical protein|nr:hypothetical protein [Sphingomonas sp.]
MRQRIALWWTIGRGVLRILGSIAQVAWYGAADRIGVYRRRDGR